MDGEKLYRLSQVADAASVSVRTVQAHAQAGKLKIQRVGPYGLPRVTEKEMEKYLGKKTDE